MAMSSVEAGYVVVAGYYAQVLWIKSQLTDYDILYDKTDVLRRVKVRWGSTGCRWVENTDRDVCNIRPVSDRSEMPLMSLDD
ncbi:hypothetical protein Tco_0494690 [Tanacetum coccineum]